MTTRTTTQHPWSLPGCPAPPDWALDWLALLGRYSWLAELAHTPQDAQHHAEGDVLTHTRMVAEALVALPAWRSLTTRRARRCSPPRCCTTSPSRAVPRLMWNATNITRQLRARLIDLFASYGARVRVVYLDAPFNTLLARNRARPNPVPEAVIARLLAKAEPPDLTEAHTVEYICTS